MQNDTSLVVDITRKASRFLQRDYFELENLQSSDRGTASFCQKACNKAIHILHEGLHKYFKTVIFDSKDIASSNFADKAVLVEVLDGLHNFERALPFFAIMVTIISKQGSKIVANKSIMNFPVLSEIYYVEKGKGAWVERHSSNVSGTSRLRVSGIADIQDALVASSNSQIELAKKIFTNIRMFESYTYALTLLISGKVDSLILNPYQISSLGIQLFIEEAGGAVHLQNDLLVASNFKLNEKIKQFF